MMAANVNPVDIKPVVKKTVNGFGSFKVALADVLTVTTVLQLATFFEYPPVIIEELGTAVSAGLLMIRYMEERGQIKPTNILTLLSALKKMCLSGTEERVKKLYEEHTGRLCSSDGQSKAQEEGKLKTFTNSLKHTYALWYNRIQPIPYIREKIFCVDDIYVESGLELVHQPTSFKHVSQSFQESGLVSLKSFRDIFDSDIIPSNRILLEGDPGYGKSTLTLQAAYDWCLGNVASPLKNVAVFILLPLRLLGNISSIFEAIRFVLMPKESLLTDDDIGEILRNSLSVIIVLDGYDEYPDKNSVIETDVINMIAGKMFPNVKVVVSTRSSSLPTCVDPTTVIIRLTGFDEKSRDEYIERTVTGGDQEASKRITNALNSSPILNDICQVPIFCVLFSHVANDQKGVIEFSSVTSFFKYVIDCFYSHMWKKDLKEPIDQSIRTYSKLNRLAFDGLTGKTQMIAWPKHTFIDTVGKDCYEELSNIGILIADQVHDIIDEPQKYDIHHTKQSEFVRFYHKLFAEWYAAKYLSSYVGGFWPFSLKHKLNKINPVDLQFVFRFACGLNKKASGRIIKYLKSVEGGASFASLCLFEQPDDPEEVVETVKGLCSDGMIIRSSDSRLLQRSNIQLLDIASRKKIEVPCLQIDHSFKVARQNEVTLESGLSLPVLLSIRKLVFTTQAEHEITKENMFGVVQYGQRCLQLKTLAFHGKFVLPLSLTGKTLKSNMNARSITVFWQLLEYVFQLDISSGKWQLSSTESLTSGIVEPEEDLEMLTSICSGGIALRRTDSRLLQRANIQFLEIASRKKIGVPCLQLDHSFKVAQQNEVTLESGLSVPVLLSIEKLVFKTPAAEHEISQENMLGVVKYGQRCLQLKTLAFHGQFVLPLSLTVETLKSNMNARSITVFWQLLEYVFQLDVSSGKWRLSSTESLTSGIVEPEEDLEMLRSICSGCMALRRSDSRLLQRAHIQFLEIASRHKIPLSCLVLDTFREAEQHSLTLENGNHVPALSTLEEIQIRTAKRIEFTKEQVIGLLCYAQKCQKLKKISFIDCLVPLCFPNDSLWPCESDTPRVLWKPGEQELDLNFTRGRWMVESQEYLTLETKDHHSLTKMCSGTVTLNTNDTKEYHRSVILLLQIAASQQIQITSLLLKSFSSADQNHLILESRNRVPLLPTLKELQIKTNLGKEFTQEQVIGLFCFAQQCQQLKTLSLVDCLLPLLLPIGSLSSLTKLRDIQVSWKPSTPDLHLDSSRGKWVLNSEEGMTLETKGQNSLQVLCSSIVYLRRTDSKPLQMSTLLLLDIASSHNIPISHLFLKWSFSGFDGEDIRLESGLSLSSLSSVEKISIIAGAQKQELTEEEVIGLIKYGIQSPRFKELWLHNCKLPSSINPDIIPEGSRSRNIKVISSNEARYLDLISGTWRKPGDIQTITEMCSGGLVIHRDTSESVQRSVIELLVEASNHDIPIDCVTLGWSFSKIDEDGNIILFSGLSLPIITSIERMLIQTEKGREMNKHEVNGILNYVQHSQRFKLLDLSDCLPPSSIPVGPSLSTLKSRGVNVFWIPDSRKTGERYKLNLDSGLWQGFPFLQGYDKPLSEDDRDKELQDVPASSLLGSPVPSQSADVSHPKKRRFDDSIAMTSDDNDGDEDGDDDDEEEEEDNENKDDEQDEHTFDVTTSYCNQLTESRRTPDLNYTRLKDTLNELLSNNDCHQVARHVTLPTDQLDAIINSNSSTKDLLDVLEERGVIHPCNVSRLLKAISVLNLNKTALFMLERYQRSIDQVLSKCLMINKEGGRLDIPCTGASLEIPSGALEEEQLIQMRIIPPHLESESLTFASNSSLVVELLPSHVNLLKPAILTLPHCLVLKKGCEWKAKIYRSHHKEGSEPHWEEQFSTYYKLDEHNCVIEIQRFSWEKFVVLDKIVEAKNIIVYAAGRCGPTDSMYLDIGYYWDLATCETVSKMNNANLLHEKRTIFYNDGKGLNISLEEFRPKNWTCSNVETKTQVISFDQVAINKGTFCTFELDKTNGTDACTCHFKAGQSPNLEDYTFLLKAPDPSSVTQPSTSDRQETARAGRSTAGIPASDRVVTTATIQGLSEILCRGWLTVGRKLGIGEPKLEAIDSCDIIAQEKVHRMLSTWKQSKGKEATCGLLGEALQAAGRKDLKEYVHKQGDHHYEQRYGDNSQEGRRLITEPIHEDERPSDVERTPTERHVKNDGLSIPKGDKERAIVGRGRGQSINMLKTEKKRTVGRGRGRGQSTNIMKSRERASVGRGRGQAK